MNLEKVAQEAQINQEIAQATQQAQAAQSHLPMQTHTAVMVWVPVSCLQLRLLLYAAITSVMLPTEQA